jgi:hypothetical protein
MQDTRTHALHDDSQVPKHSLNRILQERPICGFSDLPVPLSLTPPTECLIVGFLFNILLWAMIELF